MDYITWAMILGFALILFATAWNMLFAPKKRKAPKRLFAYFVDKYGFQANADATIFNGVYRNRQLQLRAKPFSALIIVSNPRGIHLLVEKGIDSAVTDIIDTPVEGAEELTIKSNYPALVNQMMDEELVESLKSLDVFSFLLADGLELRFPDTLTSEELEKMLAIGIRLVQAVETVNYAYG